MRLAFGVAAATRAQRRRKKELTPPHRIFYLFINHIGWSAAFTTFAHIVFRLECIGHHQL